MDSSLNTTLPHLTLVGREDELAVLRAALGEALAGHGGLVLLGGEVGIGKTALAEALCAEAHAQGMLVLIGRAYALSETPPYGPWGELCARAPLATDRASLPAPLGSGPMVSRTALAETLYDALVACAAQSPLVLFLDDLHWADPASLELLRFVARGLAALPIVLLVAYRADEVSRQHPLASLLPLLVRETHARRLDLRPLADADLAALLDGRYSLAAADARRLIAYLRAHAEGNPLYTGELLRALEEDGTLQRTGDAWHVGDLTHTQVPALLRQVIEGRVARLGEGVRALLAVAAVIGQEVPLALWGAVAEADEAALLDAVERALEARILRDGADGTAVRFAHALIREALYESLFSPRRRVWHRRVAEALLAMPAPDPDAVAYHFRQASDPRAYEWLVRAGQRAQRSYAWITAAARFEAALGVPERPPAEPRERAILLLTLAHLWRYEDRHRGFSYLEEAVRLATVAGDASLVAAARFDQGHHRLLGDDAQATAERSQSLAEMMAILPVLEALAPDERAQLPALALQGVGGEELYHRGALLYWLVWVGRLSEALVLAAPLLVRGPGTTARGLAALGMAHHHLGHPEEAERDLRDAQLAFRAAGQQVEVYFRLVDRLNVASTYYLDHPARWQHLLRETEEVLQRAAGAGRILPDQIPRKLLMIRGEWAAARAASSSVCLPDAIVGRYQGDVHGAWAVIAHYLPDGPDTEVGGPPLLQVLEFQQVGAALALDDGDLPLAHAWLTAHDRWLAWSGSILGRAEGHLGWAAYHRASADLPAAERHAEAALGRATAPRQPLALLASHRGLGELATASGRHAAAATHLDAALALAEACAAPYERALCLLALAELGIAQARDEDAARLLAAARAILTPLEARPALARAAALTARLATIAAPHPAPFGLTAREVETLRLVVAGLTNAQIADRLFITPRTVNGHLTSIYTKLAVAGRAAAIRVALDHDLR